MDVNDKASYYIEKKKSKGSQIGHAKKYFKKPISELSCLLKINIQSVITERSNIGEWPQR
jgi:hypothetical protein